jgi:hypothetical protein
VTKRILPGLLILTFLLISTTSSQAASSTDARIAQLEKQVAILRSEVDELKALQKQAIFLKNCVAKEKSTNNLKVSLKLASCTVEYFKKSKEAEQKTKK